MRASVRALLTGIIDYAGLFPPAKLPMDAAIENYDQYRKGAASWMLGQFVCPVGRLDELSPLLEKVFPAGPPLGLTVIGRRSDSEHEVLQAIRADSELITSFCVRNQPCVKMAGYEVRLPEDAVGCWETRPPLGLWAPMMSSDSACFLEIPFSKNWRRDLKVLTQVLANSGKPGGLKVRCGGPAPQDFPSPGQLAGAVVCCRDCNLPLKATAGLHHALGYFDKDVGVKAHGFLNVCAATVLASAAALDEERVRPIIEDEQAGDFAFDDGGFRWKDLSATTDQIRAARRNLFVSFGSCSFDEPREELERLGLLP
jgi:hypothetical protein